MQLDHTQTVDAFKAIDAQEQPLDPPDCGNIDVCVDCGNDCEPCCVVLCKSCKRARRVDELNQTLRDIAGSFNKTPTDDNGVDADFAEYRREER